MKRQLYLTLLICLPILSIAQKRIKSDTTVYKAVQTYPQFPRGAVKMNKFFFSNLQIPKNSKENYIDTRLLVRFIVEKDGSLSHFKILRGDNEVCNQIVNLLRSSPKWYPGRLNNKIVRVEFNLPINIELATE